MPNGLIVLICLIFSVSSHSWQEWQFSGFASIGAGKINRDTLRFIDFDDEWSVNSDSVIGLQAMTELSDQWSFISQVVANGYAFNDEDPYSPELEWLLLQYSYSESTKLRFGRIRNPLYIYSNTQEVGYTYPWVRPPVNAYPLFLAPFKHFDGADLTYYTAIEDVDLEFQVIAGRTASEYEGSDTESHWQIGGKVLASWNDMSLHFSGQRMEVSIENSNVSSLRDAFQAFSLKYSGQADAQQAFDAVVDAFVADHQPAHYLSVGGSWEIDRWTLMSEVLHFRSADQNFSNDSDGYYISASYRINRFEPYVMIGEYHNRFSRDIENKIDATAEFYPYGAGETLNDAPDGVSLDEVRATTKFIFRQFNAEQETVSLGLRYDFTDQADFKFEIEYYNFINGTRGNMYPDDFMQERLDDAVLTSFVIDVVF